MAAEDPPVFFRPCISDYARRKSRPDWEIRAAGCDYDFYQMRKSAPHFVQTEPFVAGVPHRRQNRTGRRTEVVPWTAREGARGGTGLWDRVRGVSRGGVLFRRFARPTRTAVTRKAMSAGPKAYARRTWPSESGYTTGTGASVISKPLSIRSRIAFEVS